MIFALIISVIIGGTFFFLWQEEREKLVAAEKQIKELKRQVKRGQKQRKTTKSPSGFATIEKPKKTREYLIKKTQQQPVQPLLDQNKLKELQKQTKESQDLLAEIFVQEEEAPTVTIPTSDNAQMLAVLTRLLEKNIWTRSEIIDLAGPDVMIGNLLEQINEYSCSKIDDIVVEEDGDEIYVTTEYKEHLI